MKIAKINHTRSAIALIDNEVAGMLYRYPDTNKNVKIENHLNTVNNSAKRLYNIYNSIKDCSNNSKIYKSCVYGKYGNILFKNIFINSKDFDTALNLIKTTPKINNKHLSTYMEIVDLYLRKDLKKYKENIKTFYKCLGDNNKAIENKDSLNCLYFAIKESYNKKNKIDKIKKSIEHNNMIVQPQDNIIKLSEIKEKSESNGIVKHTKKHIEKEAFKKFIDLYADLNKENRRLYLTKLARLIELFYLDDKINIDPKSIIFNDFDVFNVITKWKNDNRYYIDITKYSSNNKSNNNELKDDIRNKTIKMYRESINVLKNKHLDVFEEDINLFWIHYIENATNKILLKANIDNMSYKLKCSYIKEKIRKDIINYLSIKYIAIGKAVYNCGDCYFDPSKEINEIGKITAQDAITSFDYEYIKANETLQREVAYAVAFAANNLSRATTKTDEKTDFLLLKSNNIDDYLINKDRTIKNVLQFFGGYSQREDIRNTINSAYSGVDDYEGKFVLDIKNHIYSLRNQTMHFSTIEDGDYLNHKLVNGIFLNDVEYVSRCMIEKYCNIGLNLFYSDDNITQLITNLYKKQIDRNSQVPSFNVVISRKHFSEWIENEFKLKPDFIDVNNEGVREKWLDALYFAFKEIYYNAYLKDDAETKKYFDEALSINNPKKDEPNYHPTMNFKERYKEIKDYTFARICQIIIGEYNMQNKTQKKKNNEDKLKNPNKYNHYKTILYNTIRMSFKKYILEQTYTKFLIEDAKDRLFVDNIKTNNIDPKNFLRSLTITLYDNVASEFVKNKSLGKWYVTAKFLDGKSLNELVGSLRSYIQYVNDIKNRAEQCNNNIVYDKKLLNDISQIIKVLDVCTKVCSTYSNNVDDYFDNYNEFLSYYIDEECIKDPLYSDEVNPIVNKNIIEAKLFCPTKIVKDVLKDNKISKKDIDEYRKLKNEINSLSSEQSSKDEQEKMRNYQIIKNIIELRTFVDYGKMVNDLIGQLINWTYLRERDMLYFQLGFHYTCLNNGVDKIIEGYKEAEVDDVRIINPVLLQIISMYTYGSKYIVKDNNKWTFKNDKLPTSEKVKLFKEYSENLGYDSNTLYYAGLELFEIKKEHQDMISIRNKIDHFNYYYNNNLSILDYYSEIFDRFFSYDIKYKKGVINLLENILLNYKIIVKDKDIHFIDGSTTDNQIKKKKRTRIDIEKIISEKTSDGIYCRSKRYLDDVIKILKYKNEANDTPNL